MRKKEWFVLIACIISIACSCVCSFGEECSFIRENTLRLHILANSDSPADQALKLKIRDAVLYPPLCVSAAQTGFTEEEAQISDSLLQQEELPRYRVRLAVVEWWESLCRWVKES